MSRSGRVAIPLFFIRHGKVGGVESAVYNLLSGLDAVGAETTVGISDPQRLSPEFSRWLEGALHVSVRRQPALPGPGAVRFAEEAIFEMLSGRSPILYPNYFLPPTPHGARFRATLVHDSQFRMYPGYFSAAKRRWLDLCYRQAATADAVLFISEYEREVFSRHLPRGRQLKRSAVVYNAIDLKRYDEVDLATQERMAGRRYILAVSHQFPHKNVVRLIEAFVRLAQKDKEVELWLVGRKGPEAALGLAGVDDEIAGRVHNTGFVSDSQLSAYYRGASLFVHPSLYEGFGMTAVEALALEIPVLVSDAAALPEVTRGHASVVPATASADEWAERIRTALDCRPSVSKLRTAAKDVLHAYHPNAVAKRVLQAME